VIEQALRRPTIIKITINYLYQMSDLPEKEQLFQLIESWDDKNIELGLQLMKGNKELKAAAIERYQQTLTVLKRKTVKSLKGMLAKWEKASKNTKMQLLDCMPVREGSSVYKAMNSFCDTVDYVDFNRKGLKQLPDSIKRFAKLEVIAAVDNKLEVINDEVFEMEKLSKVDLRRNLILRQLVLNK